MPNVQNDQIFSPVVTTYYRSTTYLEDADDIHSQQQCGQQTHSDFKEKLSETMIKKYNDYKC